ncbi:MAG: exo-beta-N-acetylmuramidase NamZ domain-containing protein [Acidobacteriota bacterium]
MKTIATALFLTVLLTGCGTSSSAFDAARLREVDAAVTQAIGEHRLPGGVLWIERNGQVYRRAYGNRSLVPSVEPMTEDTVFDAASLTKVVATAPSIRLLVDRGLVSLDAPIRTYLPEYVDGQVTVRHLLTHTSGLRPDVDLQEPWSGYDEGIRLALAEQPRNRPGAIFRYSDINFLLLGEIVRRVSGQPLDAFAAEHVFAPLGMKDTGFRRIATSRDPAGARSSTTRTRDDTRARMERIAPTEDGLRGVVHDPTARRMGGVAGHAGLFTTAADLAKFARATLRDGTLGADITPPGVAIRRAFGFDLDSAYSRPRGDLFSASSYGHTGWTGGFFWIDPPSHTFYVFLSNRVHPDGKGSVVALQRRLGTLVASSLRGVTFTPPVRRVGWVTGGGDAQNGIDVLHQSRYELLRGKRIGLITNQSGVDRTGNPTVDLLRSAPGVTVAAIFSPEHGLRGTADDERIADERYQGIPVYSLYGERRKPSAGQLAGLDALVFDVQDIGTRFYTYISTMGLAMEAAGEAKVPFFVLDRVNPIGGDVVEGPLLEGKTNFVGWHPLPIRHGKTVGELAQQFRDERPIAVDLRIVPVKHWQRSQWQDEAGLPWVNPSPNMRSLDAAALYPGIGLLERALSVGRGTPTPFEILGAPYIDGATLIREVGPLPGVSLQALQFTPTASTHQGQLCGGVRLTITDRRALRSVDAGLALAAALVRLYPTQFPVAELAPLLRSDATLSRIREGRP